MTLTSEQMQKIMREVSLDLPSVLDTAEAVKFRKDVERDIAEIEEQGGTPDWTIEFPS